MNKRGEFNFAVGVAGRLSVKTDADEELIKLLRQRPGNCRGSLNSWLLDVIGAQLLQCDPGLNPVPDAKLLIDDADNISNETIFLEISARISSIFLIFIDIIGLGFPAGLLSGAESAGT